MPDNQPQTLTCPSCGAPLEFDGTSSIIRCQFCRNVSVVPGFQATKPSISGLAMDEIRRLAENGDLEDAIRQFRESYNVGSKEARDAVDALRAGRLAEKAEDLSSIESAEQQRVLGEIRELLKSGKKVEAVRKYRETFDVSQTRAKFSVDQIEAGKFVLEQIASGRFIEPARDYETERPTTSDKSSGRLGCAIIAAILVIVGGIVAFALAQPGGPFVPWMFPNGPAVLLPSEQDASPDVAVTLYNPDKETYSIGRIGAADGKLLWNADPLPEGDYTDAIVQGGDLVYVAHGMDLLAYQKSDGALAWRVSMSDKVFSKGCLAYIDGMVIALGTDQTLSGFEATTGRLVWSRQIGGYDRTIRLIDGSILLVDYINEDNDFGLIFLNPLDGKQQRVIEPACKFDEYTSDTPEPDSGIFLDEAEHALYLVYGSYNGCVQRVDLTSGQVTWEIIQDDSFSFAPYGIQSLMTPATLYFGIDNQLYAVDKAAGTLKVLIEQDDYEFKPLAFTGDMLIVRVRRTRGTERFELWGVDPASGERAWQIDFGKARPIDPPNELSALVDKGEPGWTWHIAPAGLVLVEFQAEPNQLVLKTIDIASGSSTDEKILALKKVSGDFYSVPELIGWQGNIAYYHVETAIYAFDISTGEIAFVH
jgi:outer membrane protein assembly factor BamB/ribosomal protein L7/L12